MLTREVQGPAPAHATAPSGAADAAGRADAVVLLQMGGPETLDDLEPFLANLFSDNDIIQLRLLKPWQPRLARFIARKRSVKMRERYDRIGGGSPIRKHTEGLARELERVLEVPVHTAMRYTEPSADSCIARLVAQGAERVVLLTLYPHWSRSTTGSSVNDFVRALEAAGFIGQVEAIDRWGNDPGYVALLRRQLAEAHARVREAPEAPVHLVASAHGLPRSYVKRGDPYPDEVRETFRLVCEELPGYASTHLGFQSKVGPVEWTRPYTDDVIAGLGAEGAQAVVALPLGFVSDHIETLYDLDITYREQAAEAGIPLYHRVPAFNADPAFARVLAGVLERAPRVPVEVLHAAG